MTDASDSDIAIVGLALRVPGALTPEQFWQNLVDGVESLHHYTDEELSSRGVSAADLADPSYVKAGMPLDGMEAFDPEFFGFSPKEAAILDPQHRQFYEVAWEALERAGHPPSRFQGNVGVFAGSGMAAYFAQNVMSNQELVDSVGMFLLRHTGNDKDFLSTRVAYAFDLKGPALNVQTACSTSLVATHLAVQSLLAGECDMALAGGSTVELPHRVGYHYKEGEILSPDGHCRSFDHRSKGTVFGSGCGIVVLRRLADALADGDHIHAVIKATAVNNDGAGKVGYLAPSVDGQAAAIAEALALAGVDAASIGMVECHGTGTPVGDPIEIAAMTRAFRESTEGVGFCRVGSVKSNIGHLDTAAGVVGLIKAALALEHMKIPPSLNYEAPNPAIAFDGSPFTVAARLEDWPAATGTPRRAGVNSLGVGGTNAFAILEEPPRQPASTEDAAPQLLVLSARSRRALDEASTRLAEWMKNAHPAPLADIAWTLLEGRHGFEHRRVLAVESRDEAIRLLESPDARRVFTHSDQLDRPSVVFMYPGGGAQYFRMGWGLYQAEPVFREHVDRGLALLKSRFGVNLDSVFLAEASARETVTTELDKPSVQLPLVFLVEYALTRLWEHYGVTPAALIGHSMGENAAACVSGVLSFEDALGLVLLRGQLMDEVPQGGMLAVPMPAEELKPWLCGQLDLAAANSPQLSVASGPQALLDELSGRLAEEGIEAQRVRINIAAHSRLLDGILERFRAYLNSIQLHEPKLPLISNRTGTWLEPQRAQDPEYWVEHLRNTVLFGDGVNTLLEVESRVFIEVGPGATLGSLVRQNPAAPAQRVFGSLRHPEDPVADNVYFRTVLGRLWAVDVPISTGRLWMTPRRRVPLPTYAFQHAPYWIDAGQTRTVNAREDLRPLRQENFDDWFSVPRWVQQGIVEVDETPRNWLVFHSGEPIGKALVQRLQAMGHTVVTVQAGDTYAQLDDHTFTLAPEAAGAGYAELIEALTEAELLPDRILHTWLLTWDRSFRPGSTFMHRNQEYGFYSLLYLAQALGKAGGDSRAVHWLVVANGTQRIRDESLPFADKTTALGPCAVIPREFHGTSSRFVDVQLPEPARRLRANGSPAEAARPVIEMLTEELSARADTAVVAWRDGVRWQRYLGPWKPKADADDLPRLREGAVYLITGGLGGIAGVLAEWLITEYRARLVLVGRTPLPARHDWDDWLNSHDASDGISRAILRVREIEAMGGEILPLAGDVTVAERMQEIVEETRERFGALNGVFHTAGVIRDGLIQLKTQRDIEEVFAAKVYGTMVLEQALADIPLDFLLLFSSNSAFVAPQGQVDYVGANSFLNAYADAHRGETPYPVIAVNWGIWKNVGMVAPDGARTATPEQHHATSYPLFEERLSTRDGVQQVHRIRGTLSAQDHWVIDEHRLGSGEALLPGTGYVEMIRAALAELDVPAPWDLSGLLFHQPLFVDDDAPRAFDVRLRGNGDQWQVEILAAADEAEMSWVTCATAKVTAPISTEATPLRLDEIRLRCTLRHDAAGGSVALRTRQEDHLRFGPRWRVLKQIDIGESEVIAQLSLPDGLVADTNSFALHPALLDIATGCAMDLIPGYAGHDVTRNLWAPLSYRRFSFRRALPAKLVSWVRLNPDTRAEEGFAVFDVTLADEKGEVLASVKQLTLRRIDGTLAPRTSPAKVPATTADGVPLQQKTNRKPQSQGEIALHHNATQGIEAAEGMAVIRRLLGAALVPSTAIVSSIALPALLRQADVISTSTAQGSEHKFARPQLDSDFEAPRNDTEKALAELWGKLLGVDGVGIRDSFFDLGGHSLVAVRLFNALGERFGVDLPMSVLMQAPTIADLAVLIDEEVGEPSSELDPGEAHSTGNTLLQSHQRFRFIVPMHSGSVGDRTPLFMVSGMFGNVLNLSHLAHLIGEDRPFFALQARGLFGEEHPHETFEEMAADYLQEVRLIQPKGPYLLGGFSGGGITAYEMARQLLAAGEAVANVIMLDTPTPTDSPLSMPDRLLMFSRGLKDKGPRFLLDKARQRLAWEARRRKLSSPTTEPVQNDNMSIQSERIGAAFYRAVANYHLEALPIHVSLFRPRIQAVFEFPDGRRINEDRRYVREDNFWTSYVSALQVTEVPGTHDSMVLEPNVRILAGAITKVCNDTEILVSDELL